MTESRGLSIFGLNVRKRSDVTISWRERAAVGSWFQWAGAVWLFLLPLSVYWPIAPPVAPGLPDMFVRPGLYLSDLVAGGLVLTTLFRAAKSPWRWGFRGITLPLLVIAVMGLLTVPAATSPTLAGYTGLRWLLAGLVYVALLQGGAFVGPWLTAFAIGLGINALIGVAQVVVQGPLGLPAERALIPSLSGASIVTIGTSRWLRAYGLTVHPNVLGGVLALGLLLTLPLLKRRLMQLVWWLLGLALLLSFSRSAWLAVAIVLPPLAAWTAWRRPTLRRPLAITLGGALLITLVGGALLAGQLSSRLRLTATATESRSLRERGELIAVALDFIADRPLTGVGAGNFPLAMLDGEGRALPQPVHNVPLLLAAEIGGLGALLWFVLWLTPGLALDRKTRSLRLWTVTFVAAWFAWGIIGLWDSYPWALNIGPYFSATLLAFASRALEET